MYEELNHMERANMIFDANKNEIVKMYENGITIKQLENKFDIGHTFINKKLRKNGMKVYNRKYKTVRNVWGKNIRRDV